MNKENLIDEIAKGNISPIAFYNPDGSNMLYTQKYVEEKDKEIERLKEVIQKNDKEIDNLCKNQKKEIERLNNIIKSIKEELKVYIEITIDHLETNNEEINFELRNKCGAMREIKEELLNIIEKELKEGKE